MGSISNPAAVGMPSYTAVKASAQTVNNSAVLVNDTALVIPVAANLIFELEGWITFNSGTTPDLKCDFTMPAAGGVRWIVNGTLGATTAQLPMEYLDSLAAHTALIDGAGAGTWRFFKIFGLGVNGANAGNLQFRWAQNTANASDTVVSGPSYLRITKLA